MPQDTKALIDEARLAAKVMGETDTFETGQAILIDCADALEAAQKRIDELEQHIADMTPNDPVRLEEG